MYQLVLLGLFLLILYYFIQNFRGWNGQIIELPAYNMSMIRTKFRERNAIVIRNFLSEDAKTEYDEIYDSLQEEDPKQEKDIILQETILSQLQECVDLIPIAFHFDSLWKPTKQYMRVLNKQRQFTNSKKQIHCFCAIQPMSVCLQNGNKTEDIALNTGDVLIVPRITKYAYSQGTIDCFNYFK